MAKRSPPTPLPVGSIRPRAALAAMAASIAVPPACSTSTPMRVASGCEVATMPSLPMTSERVANGFPVGRSPARASPAPRPEAATTRIERRRMGSSSRLEPALVPEPEDEHDRRSDAGEDHDPHQPVAMHPLLEAGEVVEVLAKEPDDERQR